MVPPRADLQQDQPEITVFQSKVPDIYISKHLSLHSYCFENLSKVRSRPCLIHGRTGKVMTYAEVELISHQIGASLDKLRVKQQDVIMLLLPNCPEFVLSFLGASFRGAIATAANPFFMAAEILKQAKASNEIITQACYIDKIRDLVAENKVKLMCVDFAPNGCAHFLKLTNSDKIDLPEVEIDPDDVVALLYSSGTTGLPKGVMPTHKGLITSVAQQVDGENPNLYFHFEDVILCVLPMFHIYALNSIMLCGLQAGLTILIMQKFEIRKLLELIQKHKVTIAAVPMIVTLALAVRKNYLAGVWRRRGRER